MVLTLGWIRDAAVVIAPYLRLFAGTGATRIVCLSLAARLAVATFTLPMILTVQQASGSFATAGAASAAFSVGVALSSPYRGRLVDAYSPGRALPPLATVSAAALAVVAGLAGAAPDWVLVGLAGIGGAATPPLVAAMRIEWQLLLAPRDPRLAQAYSFDSAAQTALWVGGPLLAGVAVTALSARFALGASAAMLLAGSLAFAIVSRSPPEGRTRRSPSPIRRPGVVTLVMATAFADLALGAVDVLVIAFAQAQGHAGLGGLLLAAFALGSVLGALAYGSRPWRGSPSRQLAVILVVGGLAYVLLALPASLGGLALLLLVAGAPGAAYWAATSLVLDRASGGRGGAEAFTWLSAANNAGIATGSALGGLLVEHGGTSTGFLLAAGGPVLAAATILVRSSTLRGD